MSQPMIECPYCTDGVTDEGHTCGWCVGLGKRAYTCDLCRTDDATVVTEMGEYLCATCQNTLNRNEAA